jgi:putative ABC transport system permease protein
MMIFWEIFRMAIQALRANRLRSGLTLLGVIIGVTSVITIISALEGMSQSIKQEIDRLGPTTFIITKFGIITSEEAFWEALKRKPMKFEYVKAIEEGCEDCVKISARIRGQKEVKYRNRKISRTFIAGATSEFIDIIDFEVGQGRFHSHEEDITRRRVAFIGTGIQEELYPNVDPIGKTIKIDNNKYEIIGIAKKRGSSFGNNMDNFAVIPYSAYVKDFGTPQNTLDIFVKARSLELMEPAMDQTRVILRAYRHVPYDKEDDFAMMTADSIMAALNDITKYLRLGLVGVSSISLIVGGIIIMNIMMVSVTERTREIGIRKSIGARQKDILWQFLFESLVMSLGGGLIGITAGVILGKILIGLMNMNMSPSMYAIVLGLIISSGVGLFFGIYPAMKAARMQPVKALSYE